MRVAIVGAGMAGLACADTLKNAGHSVNIYDKSRGAGGRMATRRLQTPLGEVAIDHGAQFFTSRDPAFEELVTTWQAQGCAVPWPLAGADAWIGIPGMSAIIKQMASSHAVQWGHLVTALARKSSEWWLLGPTAEIGPFDAAILAIPAEQAVGILASYDFLMAQTALMARSQPCWASMFVFDRPLDTPLMIIRRRGVIKWAARNSAKPGRQGPEAWVVQADEAWSSEQLEQSPERVAAMLCAALSDAIGYTVPQPIAAAAHRWRYALSAGTGDGALWDSKTGIGVCGDWLLGPRVESAWLSGRMLAQRCIDSDPSSKAAD